MEVARESPIQGRISVVLATEVAWCSVRARLRIRLCRVRLEANVAIECPWQLAGQVHVELVACVTIGWCPVEISREAGIKVIEAATRQRRTAEVVEWVTFIRVGIVVARVNIVRLHLEAVAHALA